MKTLKIISLVTCFLIAACAPRGETHTLDQVLKDAKTSFSQSFKANINDSAVKEKVTPISDKLESVLSASSQTAIKTNMQDVGIMLSKVILNAGYPSRPAMGALISQYNNMSQSAAEVSPAAVKLLVARTYTLLAAELNGMRFKV